MTVIFAQTRVDVLMLFVAAKRVLSTRNAIVADPYCAGAMKQGEVIACGDYNSW